MSLTNAPADKKMPDPKLLEILACPVTKTPLEYDAAAQELISRQAKLAFPIRGGIPVLLLDAARRLDEETPAALPVEK